MPGHSINRTDKIDKTQNDKTSSLWTIFVALFHSVYCSLSKSEQFEKASIYAGICAFYSVHENPELFFLSLLWDIKREPSLTLSFRKEWSVLKCSRFVSSIFSCKRLSFVFCGRSYFHPHPFLHDRSVPVCSCTDPFHESWASSSSPASSSILCSEIISSMLPCNVPVRKLLKMQSILPLYPLWERHLKTGKCNHCKHQRRRREVLWGFLGKSRTPALLCADRLHLLWGSGGWAEFLHPAWISECFGSKGGWWELQKCRWLHVRGTWGRCAGSFCSPAVQKIQDGCGQNG